MLGTLPEGLCLFRGIDSGDTNLVSSFGGIKHRDGVAICNANDNAGQISESRERKQQKTSNDGHFHTIDHLFYAPDRTVRL